MRARKPEQRPLDDGVIDGPETWRTVAGVEFCHWDRWLLRLALTEKGGFAGLAWILRDRFTDPKRTCNKDEAEALHLQMLDLQRRLDQTQQTPETLLDAEERASEWLYQKAFRRVWRSGPRIRTAAMMDTPRRRLSTRALRGHWNAFPVSPARYEPGLRMAVGDLSRATHWMTGEVARTIEVHVKMFGAGAPFDQRLALHRAAMTVVVDAMEYLDDSLASMAMMYEEIERGYLDALRAFPERKALLRDLVEFAVWEGYGLTTRVDDFLSQLSEDDADVALAALAALIRELKAERFGYQLAAARALRARLLGAADALPPEE